MKKIFLKDNVIQSRKNDNSGKNALKLIKLNGTSDFLFEKNLPNFVELIDFLKNDNDIFIISGYSLCGKSLLTSIIPQLALETTIIHEFKCSQASTLDDLLLTFFETFKKYAQKNLLTLPKTNTQNFYELINFYLNQINNSIIINLDDWNEIEDKKNKDEIMNFLSQFASYDNIKLIITTRAFDISDVKNINLKISNSIIKPLNIDALKEYCNINIINAEGIEDFHKLSRGHYLNLCLSLSYIQPTNITIKSFVEEVKNSKKNIDEYIISKNLMLISQTYLEILWLTTLASFGIPKKQVFLLPDCEEEQLSFLEKKEIIRIVKDRIYIKDYFKNAIVKNIEPLAKKNIIKGIIKFLEAQLPLKPSLREVGLSRKTIRNEIERLNNIINNTEQKNLTKNTSSYMTILGYSKQIKTNWDGFDEIIMPKNHNEKNTNKNNTFITEDLQSAEKETEENTENNTNKDFSTEINNYNLAKLLKNKFSYNEALIQYSEAFDEALNTSNKSLMIKILNEIAECYFKLGDYQNAIKNYGKAHDLASEENDNEAYNILLQIAQIYKIMYKKDLATEIYTKIINEKNADIDTKLLAEMNLYEIDFQNKTVNEIIKKYIEFLERAKNNKKILAKIHYRLGFLYDKISNFDKALQHYISSINTCDDYIVNENLSTCYYNLAEIYKDKKDYTKAIDNYQKSFAIDELTKNTEGLLITSKKIAIAYEKQKSPLAKNYYEKTINLAKTSNDNYLIACSYIDLGDYYYKEQKNLEALKTYLSARKVMENQLTNENDRMIKERINDLKIKMGEKAVEKIIKEFY